MDGDYTIITSPDGSLSVTGPTLPGSEVEITWPDGSIGQVEAGEDGQFEDTSPPDQPTGSIVVTITLNAIEIDGHGYEMTESGDLVMPETAKK